MYIIQIIVIYFYIPFPTSSRSTLHRNGNSHIESIK